MRRWIASGILEGTLHPCSTTRAACLDVCRQRPQGRTGQKARIDKVDKSDRGQDDVNAPLGPLAPHSVTSGSDMSEAVVTLAEQVERLAIQVGQLGAELTSARAEVGRLEAELAQCRREARGGGRENGQRQRQRVGMLERVGLWLRG